MRAIILNAEEKSASVRDNVPVPKPGPGELLIKVSAIALNPVDALYVSHPLGATGRTVGSDFAGTVIESVESDVPVGRRVAGFLQGACSANDRPGAFAEYVVCPADLVWLVPDNGMTLEQAAAVSLCGLTAAQGLIYRLGLPSPFPWRDEQGSETAVETPTPDARPLRVFIYGASTSVGMYAAQIIRRGCERHGRPLQLIGAASKGRFDMLRAAPYNYDALVDYRQPGWPKQVQELASGGVDFAYDCISEGQTVKLVSGTLREGVGRMAIVRSRQGGAWRAHGDGLPTEPVYGAVWEALGADVVYQAGMVIRSTKETREFAAAFYRWLAEGKLEANPIRLMPGGLERVVPDGFALHGPGKMEDRADGRTEEWMKPISAEKLVYQI